jgi:hypothetical protein
MGDVVSFRKTKKPCNTHYRGYCRQALTAAHAGVKDPTACVIVALGADGDFSVQTVSDHRLHDVDMYGRVGHLMTSNIQHLLYDE